MVEDRKGVSKIGQTPAHYKVNGTLVTFGNSQTNIEKLLIE